VLLRMPGTSYNARSTRTSVIIHGMSARQTSTEKPNARARLLAAADELFAANGIAATPVDEAVRRAGVATMTLYHHFDGKDALVAAYLRDRHERWMARWERHVEAAPDASGRLLAIFDALDDWARDGGAARGCAFVDAAAELSDRTHPAWREIEAHKRDLRDRLIELARAAGPADPEGVADELLLIYEGALSAMLIGHVERPTAQSRAIAEAVLAVSRRAAAERTRSA
jgi:AcrR family transcriptional regulator